MTWLLQEAKEAFVKGMQFSGFSVFDFWRYVDQTLNIAESLFGLGLISAKEGLFSKVFHK